ncbi:lipid droplet-associated hydrolase isoform X1 [Tupaia chinensis]|uniref:lipid droplet-associated hydrolase isoform X1 n=1 Tax=Tupaia chinensis TaxID=246437 RepID=UPI0003C8E792|nr:lipid droplet-associated hydrolase isoform X1 [Tupaia chinensis]XP_006167723.1 lipid droplet-associated hydrolase isoform X1 [Tupaia chinensis]XP_006167724.1 lipid droplet-associated hydrolase isoform X1 [Tupaia chinensis]
MDSKVKEEIPVHEEFILCGGVETQVLKCGPWTDLRSDQGVNRPKLLIFIIPGNPGFPTFYVPFAKALYSLTNRRFPVWVISHAGHILAPKDKKILTSEDPSAQEIKDVYGLHGQVEHKLAFLRAHVPEEVKLVLIGHSVGCYFSLQILKHAPELPVIRSFLLFPTIERMSESPNGRIATPLLCWLRYVLYVAGYLLLKPCPEKVKSWVLGVAMQVMKWKTEFLLANVLEPFCLANAAYLGGQEMMKIVKRDNETIKEHLSKLTFYYGSVDPWCPKEYYEDIKKDFPEGDIRLCEKKLPHAFVLSCSQEVAEMVADWLKEDLSKI